MRVTLLTDDRAYTGCPPPKKNGTVYVERLNFVKSDFQNFFTVRIKKKFVITLSLKFPEHLKCVATLRCENSASHSFGWRVKNGEDWHRVRRAGSQG